MLRPIRKVMGAMLGNPRQTSRSQKHDPIVLVRSNRIPDNSTGFIQKLQAYYTGLASVRIGKRRPFGGESVDSITIHTFVVDNAGQSIEIRDYVIRGNTKFKINGVSPVEYRGSVIEYILETSEVGSLNDATGAKTEIVPDNLPNKVEPEASNNPFWSMG